MDEQALDELFDSAFKHTIGLEGGFVDDPSDSGGATKFGITERVARANGYRGRMEDLELATAKRVARSQYWNVLRLDDVAQMSEAAAFELFDTSYNRGVGTAGRYLQTCLNAFNQLATQYPDIEVDGLVGPMTIAALAEFIEFRGSTGKLVLLRALNSLQGADYIELSQRRQKDERFVYGWILNRVRIEDEIETL